MQKWRNPELSQEKPSKLNSNQRGLQIHGGFEEENIKFVWIVNRIYLNTYFPFKKKSTQNTKAKKINKDNNSTPAESKVQWGKVDSQTFF